MTETRAKGNKDSSHHAGQSQQEGQQDRLDEKRKSSHKPQPAPGMQVQRENGKVNLSMILKEGGRGRSGEREESGTQEQETDKVAN